MKNKAVCERPSKRKRNLELAPDEEEESRVHKKLKQQQQEQQDKCNDVAHQSSNKTRAPQDKDDNHGNQDEDDDIAEDDQDDQQQGNEAEKEEEEEDEHGEQDSGHESSSGSEQEDDDDSNDEDNQVPKEEEEQEDEQQGVCCLFHHTLFVPCNKQVYKTFTVAVARKYTMTSKGMPVLDDGLSMEIHDKDALLGFLDRANTGSKEASALFVELATLIQLMPNSITYYTVHRRGAPSRIYLSPSNFMLANKTLHFIHFSDPLHWVHAHAVFGDSESEIVEMEARDLLRIRARMKERSLAMKKRSRFEAMIRSPVRRRPVRLGSKKHTLLPQEEEMMAIAIKKPPTETPPSKGVLNESHFYLDYEHAYGLLLQARIVPYTPFLDIMAQCKLRLYTEKGFDSFLLRNTDSDPSQQSMQLQQGKIALRGLDNPWIQKACVDELHGNVSLCYGKHSTAKADLPLCQVPVNCLQFDHVNRPYLYQEYGPILPSLRMTYIDSFKVCDVCLIEREGEKGAVSDYLLAPGGAFAGEWDAKKEYRIVSNGSGQQLDMAIDYREPYDPKKRRLQSGFCVHFPIETDCNLRVFLSSEYHLMPLINRLFSPDVRHKISSYIDAQEEMDVARSVLEQSGGDCYELFTRTICRNTGTYSIRLIVRREHHHTCFLYEIEFSLHSRTVRLFLNPKYYKKSQGCFVFEQETKKTNLTRKSLLHYADVVVHCCCN